ncbi:MAG: hypothetical protein SFU53_02090 [Terrimicrobiaceae bacterium]|nr:hypothetical protein [Terrimicrobiaceae bacterium]
MFSLKVCSRPLVLSVFLSLAGGGLVSAQTGDGSRPQEKPGIALVKPQPWSSDEQATVLEFQAFIDRTVKSSPGAGYFVFRTTRMPEYQVPAARVVKLVVFPDIPATLSNSEERAQLESAIKELEAIAKRVPFAGTALRASIAGLRAESSKYDSGFIKEEGAWIPRSEYFKRQASSLATLARADIDEAPNIREFDLTSNQYFRGLQDLAATETSLRPMVEGVRAYFDAARRKSARNDVLAKLQRPGLGRPEAEVLIAELRKLRPTEDAKANLFLKQWDDASAAAGELTNQIESVQAEFESTIGGEPGATPTVPEPLAAKIKDLSALVDRYRSGNPPAAIVVPLAAADAMKGMVERLPAVSKAVAAKQFLDAKEDLDPLVRDASKIGPKTGEALMVIQRHVTGEIEKFVKLRNEGKALADADKIEEAVAKYQAAYAVLPDREVAATLEDLKKQ